MFFLSASERRHLHQLLLKKSVEYGLDARHIELDTHLVFEGLHILANGDAARLYAMLHPKGHESHPTTNGGRALLMMQKIEEYGTPAGTV